MLISVIILLIIPLVTVALRQISQPVSVASIKVTVAFFSGREDPEWKLSPSVQLAQLYSKSKGYSADHMPARLGYKGMLVVDLRTNKEVLFVGPETKDLQLMLLQTIPKGLLKSGDLEEIANNISSGKITAVKPPVNGGRGKRLAPPYAPENWNNVERTRRCNNCYNYANREVTDTFAQPGYGGGQKYAECTPGEVVAAAERDGLTQLNPHPALDDPAVPGAPNHPTRRLVALTIRPETPYKRGDHHWYSLDNNHRWSHKPGQTHATDRDNGPGGGAVIQDPRIANLGNYVFARFMVSDAATVNIVGHRVCPVP